MRLTDYTDYALRVLMYLGAHPGANVTTREIAAVHGISRHHLTKIVHQLGQLGLLCNSRGRSGGVQLAIPPERIMLGSVVRMTEPDFAMVGCFHEDGGDCVLAARCRLRCVLQDATNAYLERLDRTALSTMLEAAPAASIPIHLLNA
jgi:Rrf2 family nitric oxide-sensitive transcriptional repressor